jgi:hypothetical protein
LFAGRGGLTHDYGGSFRAQASGEKLVAQACEIISGHVNNQGGFFASQLLPVHFFLRGVLRSTVPAHDDDARTFPAIGERNAHAGGRSGGGGDSGDHLERDSGGFERVSFFGKAAKDRGISAVQPNNFQTLLGGFNHARINLGLRDSFCAAALADVYDFGLRPSERKNRGWHQRIVKDHIGAADETISLYGQKFRVARTGTDQIDSSCEMTLHDVVCDFRLRVALNKKPAYQVPCRSAGLLNTIQAIAKMFRSRAHPG